MDVRLFLFVLGRMVMLNSLTFFLLFCSALWWNESVYWCFLPSMAAALVFGSLLTYWGRGHAKRFGIAEGAWYVVFVWVILGVFGMLPYIFAGILSGADAFFESVSAYTTTGLSCFAYSTNEIPHSFVLLRAVTAWMGGLNFIVLAGTIIPQVSGYFGSTLSARQEMAFSLMAGRMKHTAFYIGCIYFFITVVSASAYKLAGLSLEDACVNAFLSISTTGGVFSVPPEASSIAMWVCILSMIGASSNFFLYWKSIERKSSKLLFQNTELRVYSIVMLASAAIVAIHLRSRGVYPGEDSLMYGFFHVVSFYSTTGFMAVDVSFWPEFDVLVLFLAVFAGGCIGSVAGGLHMMRLIILYKITVQEIRRLLHPRMVVSMKVSGIPVEMKIISCILSFFSLFMAVFLVSVLILSASGTTPLQAMGIAAGCLSTTGAAAQLFGKIDFAVQPLWVKMYCSLLMIIGRVEIFAFFIVMQTGIQWLKQRW